MRREIFRFRDDPPPPLPPLPPDDDVEWKPADRWLIPRHYEKQDDRSNTSTTNYFDCALISAPVVVDNSNKQFYLDNEISTTNTTTPLLEKRSPPRIFRMRPTDRSMVRISSTLTLEGGDQVVTSGMVQVEVVVPEGL